MFWNRPTAALAGMTPIRSGRCARHRPPTLRPAPEPSPLLPTPCLLCLRAAITHTKLLAAHEGRAGAALSWSQTACHRLPEPICLLQSQAGTWVTQNQSCHSVSEKSHASRYPSPRAAGATGAHLKRQEQPLQDREELGPQDQESQPGCASESGWGGFKHAPPTHQAGQVMLDPLQEGARVGFLCNVSSAHPDDGIPVSLEARDRGTDPAQPRV